MMRFLGRVRPACVLSSALLAAGRPRAASADLGAEQREQLPRDDDDRFPGFALTVEYGGSPGAARLRRASDAILRLFGAWRGGVHGTS